MFAVLDLLPTNPGDWWTAISAVVTAVALWYAIRGTRYAAETVRIEQTPVITLEYQHAQGTVWLRNLGRGVALMAFVTDEDGKLVQAVSGLAANGAAEIPASGIEFSLFSGNFIYAQDIAGRWVRTFAVYRGLRRSENTQFNNRIDGPIWKWRVPRGALRELKHRHRSALQHMHVLGSYFHPEAWMHSVNNAIARTRRAFLRSWHGVGEASRGRQFASRSPVAATESGVSVEDRAAWPVDVDGYIECSKAPRLARQLSCAWEADQLVCEILVLGGPFPPDVRGLLVIDRSAYDALPSSRDDRNSAIRERFDRYICGRRPQEPFVFRLRKIGPAVMNL
jgi:hypothetical protein